MTFHSWLRDFALWLRNRRAGRQMTTWRDYSDE